MFFHRPANICLFVDYNHDLSLNQCYFPISNHIPALTKLVAYRLPYFNNNVFAITTIILPYHTAIARYYTNKKLDEKMKKCC